MAEVLLVVSFLAMPISLVGAIIMAFRKKPSWKKWLAGLGVAFVIFAFSGAALPDAQEAMDNKAQPQVAAGTEVETSGEKEIDNTAAEPAATVALQPQQGKVNTSTTASVDPSTPVSSDSTKASNKATSEIATIKAKVTRIVDGDTIEVGINGKTEKVRFIGVNTPETSHPTKGVEYYGKEAKAFTINSLSGKTVYLELDAGERDKYGRLLAYIWLQEPASDSENEIRGKMFNATLLLGGYAQVMTIPPNVKYSDLFVTMQREARENEKGLWKGEQASAEEQTAKPSAGSSSPSYTGGSGPNGETIKGNLSSSGEKIYHIPGGAYYDKTNPEEWFFTEEEAKAAGYRKSKR